jgi:hypothetical protein
MRGLTFEITLLSLIKFDQTLTFATLLLARRVVIRPDWKVWKLHGRDFESLIVNI